MKKKPYSRRDFIKLGGAGAVTAAYLSMGGLIPVPSAAAAEPGRPQNGDEALKALMEGNKRFVKAMKEGPGRTVERRMEVVEGQAPFASILACADSRVAPEILFDQGIGDLFVVRVAGNIVNLQNYGIMGSLEYGALALGAPLIMVLGHSRCGAVSGAIGALQKGTEYPGSINDIVQTIKPAVDEAKGEKGDLLHNATIENVKMGVSKLENSDPVISNLVKEGKVKVVGANYDLKTGEVELIS